MSSVIKYNFLNAISINKTANANMSPAERIDIAPVMSERSIDFSHVEESLLSQILSFVFRCFSIHISTRPDSTMAIILTIQFQIKESFALEDTMCFCHFLLSSCICDDKTIASDNIKNFVSLSPSANDP